jgi:DNA helicase-2/ATP-dependent DNA helicase PcrA
MAALPPTELDQAIAKSTADQRRAITSTSRQLAIVAGAGSGKTRVLTLRTAYRSREGTLDPSKTLVATFSRKAAEELRQRLFRLGVRDVTCSTIHAVALRILNDHRSSLGRPDVSLLLNRSSLLDQALRAVDSTSALPTVVEAEIAWAKSRRLDAESYAEGARAKARSCPLPWGEFARVFSTYESLKRQQGRLDLDDLLIDATRLVVTNEVFRSAVAWRFRHIFLDETQDLNPAQLHLILAICGEDPDLTFVGDPNQAIYGWNGSDASLMDDLTRRFAETETIYLRSNKRSSRHIVEVANAALGAPEVNSDARERGHPPTITRFATDEDEAQTIARQIWRSEGATANLSSVAVLARTNAQLQRVADALDGLHVAYKFAGSDLTPASDVRVPTTFNVGGGADQTDDRVTLSTFHRSKGLEWPTVYLIGLADSLVPYRMARTHDALAEEQRLFYVALTRPTERLQLSWAERPGLGVGEQRRRQPSRWLHAIERHLERQAQRDAPLDAAARQRKLDELRQSLTTEAPPH